ncbi:hypothetical protein E8E12_007511 [Didymella heteroderae]|uniref:Sequence-specific DNA binding RNA polymerase II transcription factor n=1 Tax=Didymella heteroderae TaxID=1769908 RepID=A0A9P5C1E4_9PLEO|nr:hypothetical protein E8E12_007511 [Didymella heteroderae]
MKELQLMHQWSTVTYMHSGPRNMEVFRDWVVDKSLAYSYLMDILLAFTSLHSASQAVGSSEAYEHVTTALHYQNQSIAELNRGQLLVRITQETCEPVVLVTALNAVCTLLASMVPATSGEHLESLSEVMLRTRRYMLGLNEVVEHCRSWTEDSELARIFMSPTVQKLEDGGLMTADRIWALCDQVLVGMDLDDPATPFFRSMLEKLEKAYMDNNVFTLSTALNVFKLFKTRTWFCIPFVIGLIFELSGYLARANSHLHPTESSSYIAQTLLIFLAPTIFAASVYMFLGRIVLATGHMQASILRPTWLTKIFPGGDILCFLTQAAGAAMLVKPNASKATRVLGKAVVLAGLIIQLFVFGFFVIVVANFHIRTRKVTGAKCARTAFEWQIYLVMLYAVSGLITVRNIFRVAEYAMGGHSYLLAHEWPIHILDGLLMALAMAICTT